MKADQGEEYRQWLSEWHYYSIFLLLITTTATSTASCQGKYVGTMTKGIIPSSPATILCK